MGGGRLGYGIPLNPNMRFKQKIAQPTPMKSHKGPHEPFELCAERSFGVGSRSLPGGNSGHDRDGRDLLHEPSTTRTTYFFAGCP